MESVLKDAGSCGKYQVFHVIFSQLPRFVGVWALFFMIFGGYDPGWRCVRKRHQGNGNLKDDKEINHVSNKSEKYFTGGVQENGNYWNHSVNLLNDAIPQGIAFNGKCSMLNTNATPCELIEFNPDSKTLISEFSLVCDRAYLVKIIIFIQGLGFAVGPLIGGQIGDKFGRKVSLYGCTLIIGISSGVSIFSTHWIMFAVCCFFNGACANSIFGLSPLFCMELLNSKWRGYYNSFLTSNFALCTFTVCSFLLKDWKHLHIITCVVSLLSCFGYFILSESPRWLLLNNKTMKAKSAISKIAKFNGKDLERNENYFSKLQEQVKMDKNNAYTILNLFQHKHLLKITLKLGFGFLIISAANQGTSFGIKSLPGQFYLNAIMAACVEMIVVLISGPMCHFLGRRFAGISIGIFGASSCAMIIISLSLFEDELTKAWVINIFTFLVKAFWEAASGVAVTFGAELLPTVVRSVSIGVMRCLAGIGALIAPVIIPSKDSSSLLLTFSIVGVCYCFVAVLFMSFRETKGSTLKDRIVDVRCEEVNNLNLNSELENRKL